MKKFISIGIILVLSLVALTACGEAGYRQSMPIKGFPDGKYNPEEVAFSLVSGVPPLPDPDPLVYIGSVHLKGWIVQVPFYVGEPEDHFRVAEESLSKLPQEIIDTGRKDFKLKDIGESDIEELKKYSEGNPAEIIVEKLTLNMEGNPILNFARILIAPEYEKEIR